MDTVFLQEKKVFINSGGDYDSKSWYCKGRFKNHDQNKLEAPSDGISILKLNIACQFLHFAKTEDIWLKSALKVERGVLLTSPEN